MALYVALLSFRMGTTSSMLHSFMLHAGGPTVNPLRHTYLPLVNDTWIEEAPIHQPKVWNHIPANVKTNQPVYRFRGFRCPERQCTLAYSLSTKYMAG
eukprot:3151354-Amphidinium_carterae.1